MQVFTSDHALKLEWIPDWVAIIGSGYIGLEFSDVYTALGSEVTFIEVGSSKSNCTSHTTSRAAIQNKTHDVKCAVDLRP